ncbi:tetratricopeptide repeat protein [bacterium]|nr:MAG: tetratricopeptide repeat protein [bacterium]
MNSRDRNPLLMAIVAICALGAGITGTLWWKQENTPPTAVAATSATPAATSAPDPMQPSTDQLASAEKSLAMGNQFYDNQQWPQAIEQYRLVIASGFDNPDVRTDLGNAMRFNGDPKQALEQYKIAQNLDPNHEQSLFNQGGLWAFAMNNPAKGVEAWQAYLKRFPKGSSAQDARKFIAENQKKKKG